MTFEEQRKRAVYAIGIAALIIMILVASVVAYTQLEKILGTTGTIKTIGLEFYSDPGAGNLVTSINWGIIEPGQSVNRTVYAKSTSTVPVNLTLSTQNYIPAVAVGYLTLTWNFKYSDLLDPAEIRPITFTLHASSTVTGFTNFSFDILVVAHD